MPPLLILVIVLAANQNPGEALSLNTTGFENCIFHLVDAEGGSSLPTRDLIESILTLSGRRHLWTLSTHNDPKKDPSIAFSFELEERCSVNIIVKRKLGPFGSIFRIFGLRIYNPNAMIIYILSSHHRELVMRIAKVADSFVLTHAFFNILGLGVNSGIEESFVFCGRCPSAHSLFPIVDPTHLLRMWKFSQDVRRNFHQRNLQATIFPSMFRCQKWYPVTYSFSAGQRTACDPRQVFIQNLAHRLNSTLEYDIQLSSRGIFHTGQEAPTGVLTVDFLAWHTNHPSLFHSYLRDSVETGFIYCRRNVERESFSFFFLSRAL